jgi:hypothetical protein
MSELSIYSTSRPQEGTLTLVKPSMRRTLGDAARLQRDVLLAIRRLYPEWHEFLTKGEPRRLVLTQIDDETQFINLMINLRRTNWRAKFHDELSDSYTQESVPFLYTSMNSFWMPDPRKPDRPYENKAFAWSASFNLGSGEGMYERISIDPPKAVEQRPHGGSNMIELMKYTIARFDSSDAIFYNRKFNEIFRNPPTRMSYWLGWLNYFSHPPLVEQILKHPRGRPFHKGAFLQLSDDPADMMDDAFAKAAFDYAQTLAPYWPPLLSG